MIRLFTVIMVSLFLFANFVQAEEPYVPKEKEELYGTWANKEYDGKYVNSKWIYTPDGTWASHRETSGSPVWEGQYSITAKWTDAADNVWYKITWKNKYSGGSGYALLKISDSGETLETAISTGDYPVKIDPNKPFWQYGGIHYRQKGELMASEQEKQEFNDEQKELWDLEEKYWECIKNFDIESYKNLLHENTLPWPSGEYSPVNKAQTVLFIKQWLAYDRLKSYQIKPDAIQLFNDVAIVCYSYMWKGARLSDSGRITHTWIKQKGVWKMIGGMNASYNSLPKHFKIE